MDEKDVETENKLMNKLICGDNLAVMKRLDSDSVDLAYIDPPFFTNRDFAVIWNDGAEIRQFKDRWITEGDKATKDMTLYIDWMEVRIKEIHRILKPTGSFYLHCDKHAVHYLKVLCDDIFGYSRFVNEIIWDYGGASRTQTAFPQKHDTLLFYTKSKKYTFNPQYLPIAESYVMDRCRTDSDGRKWVDQNLGNVSEETKDRMLKEGRIYKTKTGNLRRKQYIDEMKGTQITDVWGMDIINSQSKERLGYPTQKPEALLERIILASSNEGDTVLDAFGGGGTTLAVASKLKRNGISIDVSPTACRVQAERLDIPVEKIIGMPLNTKEIGSLDGWEFQNYIIHLLDPNNKRGIKVHGRGADGGIDGRIYGIAIEVKKHKSGTGIQDLDRFVGVLNREKETEGVFIALRFTTGFIKEVIRLNKEGEYKIHMFTLDDIIKGNHKELVARFRNEKNDFMNF